MLTEVVETDAFFDGDYGFATFTDDDNNDWLQTWDTCEHVYGTDYCDAHPTWTRITIVESSSFRPKWTPLY